MIKKLLFSLVLMSSVGNSIYACCSSKTEEQINQKMLKIARDYSGFRGYEFTKKHTSLLWFFPLLIKNAYGEKDLGGDYSKLFTLLSKASGAEINPQALFRRLFFTLPQEEQDYIIEHASGKDFEQMRIGRDNDQARSAKEESKR